VATQDIAVDVIEVGERLSCTYRRARLSALLPTRLGRCRNRAYRRSASWGRTWIAELGTAGAKVGGDGS
jgi:hypothetical protein